MERQVSVDGRSVESTGETEIATSDVETFEKLKVLTQVISDCRCDEQVECRGKNS
jgi:hypothetical protein